LQRWVHAFLNVRRTPGFDPGSTMGLGALLRLREGRPQPAELVLLETFSSGGLGELQDSPAGVAIGLAAVAHDPGLEARGVQAHAEPADLVVPAGSKVADSR
jgi:hypothetical protein